MSEVSNMLTDSGKRALCTVPLSNYRLSLSGRTLPMPWSEWSSVGSSTSTQSPTYTFPSSRRPLRQTVPVFSHLSLPSAAAHQTRLRSSTNSLSTFTDLKHRYSELERFSCTSTTTQCTPAISKPVIYSQSRTCRKASSRPTSRPRSSTTEH